MSATLSLLERVERPSIPDADPAERLHDRPRQAHDGCEHERVRRLQVGRERSDRGDHASPAVGGVPTLDDLLTGAWETIMSDQSAACPVCRGVLEPRHGAGAGAGAAPVGARCTSCGTELF